MSMSPTNINDLNLHEDEVEDYSSDIPHDQLPSVEEARMQAGVVLRKTSPASSRKKTMAFGLLALTLLIIAIAVPISNKNKPVNGDEQIGNSVKKAVHKISLNGKSDFKDKSGYQSFAKRWLLEDKLVEDYTYDQLQQRYAMYCLHHATNPEGWVDATGWKRKGVPECDWYGVTCDPDTSMVTRIDLRDNGLKRHIPPEVSLIPQLNVFNVNDNPLTGSIPDHICDLQTERALDIKVDCAVVTCSCCSNCAQD
jgi:hypothetical protein